MSLCINPNCDRAKNQVDQGQQLFCSGCGSSLLLNDIYRVLSYLGGGGFASTYLVEALSDGNSRKVLKVLREINAKTLELFDREAAVLQKLDHPGIPKVGKYGRFNYFPRESTVALPCLVIEWIEGENLASYLEMRDLRPISEQAAIHWLRELTEILDLVHGAKYFHRDIKPTNIMIRNTGKLALIDFGIAREETETYQQNYQAQLVTSYGTKGYTPYEQAFGQAEYRSDFFALGRTFVFLLTGQAPHLLPGNVGKTGDVGKKGFQWRQEVSGCSQEFLDLIDYLMCPDVEDRPRDTKEILERLKALEKSDQPVPILSSIIEPNAKSISESETEPTIDAQLLISEPEESRSLVELLGLNVGINWFLEKLKLLTPVPSFTPSTFSQVASSPNFPTFLSPDTSPNLTAKDYFNRGISKHNLGDYQGAIVDYDQAIQLNPDDADAYNNRGRSKYELNDYEGAIADYNQAIKLNPDLAEAYYNRGCYKGHLKDYEDAINDCNQAIKLNPVLAEAYNALGLSKYNLGDYQGAILDYNQAIKLNPDLAKAYYNRGRFKNNLGDYQGAISDYDQAIKLNPDYVNVYGNRGISKNNLGDYQGAIRDYEQTIKLNLDCADAYYSRGLVYQKLNDNDNAINDFRQAAKLYQKQNNQTYYQKSIDRLKELGTSL